MKITKIHTAGSDYLICEETVPDICQVAKRLLDRRFGIGADGLITVLSCDICDALIKMFDVDGREVKYCSTAIIAAAKFLYDKSPKKKEFVVMMNSTKYRVKLSVMGRRVLCAWLVMPLIVPKPLEQYKYFNGTRGEVLRACITHPRVSVYELYGEHTVFMLESCAALRSLNMQSVCHRLEEVLFYGENTDLHFVAVSGDNVLSMRSWRCRKGEISASGEGAALSSYAAAEYSLVDSKRVIVKTNGGSFCVEIGARDTLLCAKCETVFVGEAV